MSVQSIESKASLIVITIISAVKFVIERKIKL